MLFERTAAVSVLTVSSHFPQKVMEIVWAMFLRSWSPGFNSTWVGKIRREAIVAASILTWRFWFEACGVWSPVLARDRPGWWCTNTLSSHPGEAESALFIIIIRQTWLVPRRVSSNEAQNWRRSLVCPGMALRSWQKYIDNKINWLMNKSWM